MYTFRNGDKRSGGWDSGTLKTPLPPSDPAVQRAVQVRDNLPVQVKLSFPLQLRLLRF
jgi:hypothetical protein